MRFPSPLTADGFIEEAENRIRDAGLSEAVQVDLSAPRPMVVSLDMLKVIDPQKRRAGLGSRVLQLLLSLSDESGMTLEVIPRTRGRYDR